MKLTSLLTQYLYTHHELHLPGIGSFHLDPNVAGALENTRNRQTILEGITFNHNSTSTDTTDLVSFISAQSGKMKALATSDLESYIQLAQQFLNIGKPFVFEGIGTLVRLKPDEYEFTPVALTGERLKDFTPRESNRATPKEEAATKYESFLSEKKPSEGMRKPVLVVLVLAGLALAIWGGYAISKKAANKNNDDVAETASVATSISFEDSMKKVAEDSIAHVAQQKALEPEQIKYVLEVANSKRAFKRYNQLLENRWKVQMETSDSIQYKLYMLLPALNVDTTRVRDSLSIMLGRKVYIEHQN